MLTEEDETQKVDKVQEAISQIEKISGIDLIYFLNKEFEIIKEKHITSKNNYLEQVKAIIKSTCELSIPFYNKSFFTYTFLNEEGLILVSTVEQNYLIVIGGEREPVDLITLLKIVKLVSKR